MIITGKTHEKTFVFEDIESYASSAMFNDLIYLLFEKCFDDRLPLLPPNLQTFRELLLRVWSIIEQHEHRDALHDILRDELNASIGVCFTGRFSRVVNVLNGFIDGVDIGISSSEQMQSRISHAVKMGQKQNKTNDAIKAEVGAILDEFKIERPHERQAWLDAVE